MPDFLSKLYYLPATHPRVMPARKAKAPHRHRYMMTNKVETYKGKQYKVGICKCGHKGLHEVGGSGGMLDADNIIKLAAAGMFLGFAGGLMGAGGGN